ncbi:MAG: ATP-binding protein [Deltaproteobacteria bacterium]|nr:ATP-binding protein [Deltaproteobacteria bacterium]
MIPRMLRLPEPGEDTFFLWGPRQTGKTTLLADRYPSARRIDLLKSDVFRRYATRPELLREEVAAMPKPRFVVIDEIQKVPDLLDEVHWMHENLGARFALCGSSPRKLKRGGGNLLGGRAVRYELHGLVSAELGGSWNLDRMLSAGFLPRIYLSERPERLLDAYVSDYLKEEIAAEGVSRRLPIFSEFLAAAALSDTCQINLSAIGRECGVSYHAVDGWFGVLVDTLQGRWLPAYRKRPKRKISVAPKFYFSDVGVVNLLARRGRVERGSDLFGKALENWLHHELATWNDCSGTRAPLSFWRLASGAEVDFVLGDMEVNLEAKASPRITTDHLRGLEALAEEHPHAGRRIIVSLDEHRRRTPSGIEIMPVRMFVDLLWSDKLLH